jgi:hypothetical protein
MSAAKPHDPRFRLCFDHAFGARAEGLIGGLFLWNNDTVVTVKSISMTHIDAKLQNALTHRRGSGDL